MLQHAPISEVSITFRMILDSRLLYGGALVLLKVNG